MAISDTPVFSNHPDAGTNPSGSHPAGAGVTPKVVLVYVCHVGLVQETITRTYGGVAMTALTPVDGSLALEPHWIYPFILLNNSLSGTQTVAGTASGSAGKDMHVYSYETAGGDGEIVDQDFIVNSALDDPSIALDNPSGKTVVTVGYLCSGKGASSNVAADANHTKDADNSGIGGGSGSSSNSEHRTATTTSTTPAVGFVISGGADDVIMHAIALAEAAAGGTAHEVDVNDSLTLADAVVKTRGKTIAEPLALADQLTRSVALERTIPDTLALADTVVHSRGVAIAESLALADQLTTQKGKGVTIEDTVALADALALARGVTVADIAELADEITATRGVQLELDDSLALADARALSRGLTLADQLTLDDARTFARAVLIADQLALADNTQIAGAGVLTVLIEDALALSDAITHARTLTLTDTLALTDATALSRSVLLGDALALADLLAFARAISIADQLALEDAISTGGLVPHLPAVAAVAVVRADATIRLMHDTVRAQVIRSSAPASIISAEGDAHV